MALALRQLNPIVFLICHLSSSYISSFKDSSLGKKIASILICGKSRIYKSVCHCSEMVCYWHCTLFVLLSQYIYRIFTQLKISFKILSIYVFICWFTTHLKYMYIFICVYNIYVYIICIYLYIYIYIIYIYIYVMYIIYLYMYIYEYM